MSDHDMPQTGLVYNGTEIRAVGERLNLTDMWKAAGAEQSRKPAEWLRSADAVRFIEFLAETLNVGNPHNEENQRHTAETGNSHLGLENLKVRNSHLFQFAKGRSGSTVAHWQIGLAYAKYLSPEFHMWCNTVVRERMEGKAVGIPDDLVRRTDGIARMLAHKVTGTEKMVKLIADSVEREDQRIEYLETAVITLAQAVKEMRVTVDERARATVDYVSVRNLLDAAGALPKGRNSINRQIGHALRDRALTRIPPVPLRRCAHSGVWLFPIEFADVFMTERGNALVVAHNDAVRGQGTLDFAAARRKRRTDKPDDAQPPASA